MTKAGVWKKDWLLGLGVSFALLASGGSRLLGSAKAGNVAAALDRKRVPAREFGKRLLRRVDQNVARRDVKPADVMYEPEDDVVKVTGFDCPHRRFAQDQNRNGTRRGRHQPVSFVGAL